MLNLKIWATASAFFAAISFVVCVIGGVIAPGLPIPHRMLEVLPGFVWISPGAFVLGLVETFLFGLYAGGFFALLHNFFMSRWDVGHVRRPARKAA